MGSSIWDIDTGIVQFSEAAYRLFGYGPSELTLSHDLAHNLISSHIHPDDRERVRMSMHPEPVKDLRQLFFRILTKDGEVRYLNVVDRRVFRDASGKPRKILMIFQDVTCQQHYIDALRLDEARLEALLELNNMSGAPAGEVSRFTLDQAIQLTGSKIGLISIINPEETGAEIFSVSEDMMKGWKMDREHLTFPLSRGVLWTEPFRTRKPLIVNDYNSARPGKKGLPAGHGSLKRLLAVPIIDNDRVRLIAMVGNKETDYDASDVRQLTLLMSGVWSALSRAKAGEELFKAKTRAELYLDLMSHDIMNLNQVAFGFLEFVRDEMVTAGLGTGLIDKSNDALKQMTCLINNVRKIQSVESSVTPMKPVDVNEVIASVIRRYDQLPGRDVTFNFEHNGCAFARANELLPDVIDNIISNSIKHSTGPLFISISQRLESINNCEYLNIVIEDDGPGIPDHMKEKIFDRLYRGDSGVKGMGLGLYLVKTLVESYRGKVQVEDRIAGDHNKGTRFTIMLPVATAALPVSKAMIRDEKT